MEYILAAVNSARKAFPSHLTKKKNGAKQENQLNAELSNGNSDVAVNGQFEEWTEEGATDVNGSAEVKGKWICRKITDRKKKPKQKQRQNEKRTKTNKQMTF